MRGNSVLIVEDDCLIASDVAQAVTAAGFEVVGMAISEAEALAIGQQKHPDFAIVDITLGPGDGRKVALALAADHTAVLFASSQCSEAERKKDTGAMACLPKPYLTDNIGRALTAVGMLADGEDPGELPGQMFELR